MDRKRPLQLFLLHRHLAFTEALSKQIDPDPRFYPLRRFEEPQELLAALEAEPADLVLVERHPHKVIERRHKKVFLPEVIRELKARFPEVKVLPLDIKNLQEMCHCRAARANGYVPRDASLAEVIDIVLATSDGKENWPPEVPSWLEPREKPTDRELEVLACIAERMANKEVAEALGISVSTVKAHVHHILHKLKVPNRHKAVWWAEGMGFLPPPRE